MTKHALLSGGIGAGKSAAAAIFRRLGATVIDSDHAAHRVLEPGGAAFDAVSARWPTALVDGVIDRRRLGRLVFGEAGAVAELESITHPAIRSVLAAEVAAASGAPLVLVEVPLPVDPLGAGWPRVVIDAPEDVRIFRLRLRGMEPEEIAGRMAAQPRRDEWLRLADHVIDNGAGLEELEPECRRVWAQLMDGTAP
jgi:dephospho-CoA kinase